MMFGADDIAAYHRDGFFLAKGLVSPATITELLQGVDRLLCSKVVDVQESSSSNVFAEIHQKIMLLAQRDRAALAGVYDAMRKLLPFWSLVSELGASVRALTGYRSPGVIFRGCGIRLDLPNEDQWRSQWHQEYHSQMSSVEGVTAWFNLVGVQHEMGPVELLQGSHRGGLLPIHCNDPMNTQKNYTQTFLLDSPEELSKKYPRVRFETEVGDVLFLHFLTVHQSGFNRSEQCSRITCQARYFDMAAAGAVERNWMGGWQDGGDFTKAHPDKVLP